METSKGPEREFLLPWLCSAAVVTVIRLLHAADLGYDLTSQIQAGQNILAGKGLTTYAATAENLADPLAVISVGFRGGRRKPLRCCTAILLADTAAGAVHSLFSGYDG